MKKQMIMFGADVQLDRLSKLGDPLEKINGTIDWEIFRSSIKRRIRKAEYSKGGRPPEDDIMMFKITLLQDWNNISDDSAEYLVNCRLDWQRFLGMELGEKSPDAKTIWLFKERLGKEGLRELFELFNKNLCAMGVVKREGSLIDATFVDAPKQRNSREENKTIKGGETPEDWKKPENANKLAQKDTDAR
jgi:transposase